MNAYQLRHRSDDPVDRRGACSAAPGSTKAPARSSAATAQAFRSILVPLDLSARSDRVVGRLAQLPLEAHAHIVLLHVVPSLIAPRELRRALGDARKALDAEAQHLRERLPDTVEIDIEVRVGIAPIKIAEHASRMNADLIVMGRGQPRLLREAFLGSTAERVVRQAQRPVLAVRLQPRGIYQRPALAVGLDSLAEQAVHSAFKVLASPLPAIDVVHAFDIPFRGLIYPSLPRDEAKTMREAARANALHGLTQVLAQALSTSGLRHTERPCWKHQVRFGSPREVVSETVAKAGSDLLVVSTRACSGAAYAFVGSVAGDLLRAVDCDVLIVPPAPASRLPTRT
ncbi:MAG: universal stress protein [Panacagrimonas sp.]|jgi:nucleotide-binding universal stress UspA family protein|nr:universal stress protein [Panacagrimonas sp.]MCC2656903.1 universal stress protein [Panacagrimonas sp.]